MQRFKQHVVVSKGAKLCLVTLQHWCVFPAAACLASWSSACSSCHLFASVFRISYLKEKKEGRNSLWTPLPLSLFTFPSLRLPTVQGQSCEINRNKLWALHLEISLQKTCWGERWGREETDCWRDEARQVEECKQEPIWQLEASHTANHQRRFKIDNWNVPYWTKLFFVYVMCIKNQAKKKKKFIHLSTRLHDMWGKNWIGFRYQSDCKNENVEDGAWRGQSCWWRWSGSCWLTQNEMRLGKTEQLPNRGATCYVRWAAAARSDDSG